MCTRQGYGLRVDALTKQEFRCRVKSQWEEQGREIHLRRPAGSVIGRKMLQQVLDVDLFQLQIGDLVSCKLWSQHSPGVFPGEKLLVTGRLDEIFVQACFVLQNLARKEVFARAYHCALRCSEFEGGPTY